MACYLDNGMQAAVVVRASCSFVQWIVLFCFALLYLYYGVSNWIFSLIPSALLLGFSSTPEMATHAIFPSRPWFHFSDTATGIFSGDVNRLSAALSP